MIEIIIILIALYWGYRTFRHPGEHFFYDDNNLTIYI